MKRNPNIQVLVIGVVLVLCQTGTSWAENPPPEPGESALINEDVNVMTGLYIREYSLQDNGVVDYRTARQIILSEYSAYWNTVVETKEFPLFYWYDANQDGTFDMWVDRKVDGCSCDIVPYDVIEQHP